MRIRNPIAALLRAMKRVDQPAPSPAGLIDAKLREALAHHTSGRLIEAEQLYKEIIRLDPVNADSIHLLGMIAHQADKHDIASALVREAIELDPLEPAFHSNLGAIHLALAEDDLAVASCRRALELDPELTAASINLACALERIGRHEEAAAIYRAELESRPGPEHPSLIRGDRLLETGMTTEALACFRDGCRIDPQESLSHLEAGLTLARAEDFPHARDELISSLNHDPGNDRATVELGLVYVALKNFAAATDTYQERNERCRAPGASPPSSDPTFCQASRGKLRHDAEQLTYLRRHALLSSDADLLIAESLDILDDNGRSPGETRCIELAPLASPEFLSKYNRMLHYRPTPALDADALSCDLDAEQIQSDYYANGGITYFDDLLSEPAMDALRAFCLESTIWYQIEYQDEVGASSPQGFSCPLLFQIAEEMRARFSRVLDGLYFRGCWAFRYYGECSSLREHIDKATVSINFWLTPDSANENPDTGGLVYWNKHGPDDFLTRSTEENDRILHSLIAAPDAVRRTVPYRCNRAAMFDAMTIHSTDAFSFRSGYENRRTNVTYLFGPPGGDA